nr:immunoglobulin light chain junction region [Macaca mulatta]
CQQYSRDPFTF